MDHRRVNILLALDYYLIMFRAFFDSSAAHTAKYGEEDDYEAPKDAKNDEYNDAADGAFRFRTAHSSYSATKFALFDRHLLIFTVFHSPSRCTTKANLILGVVPIAVVAVIAVVAIITIVIPIVVAPRGDMRKIYCQNQASQNLCNTHIFILFYL